MKFQIYISDDFSKNYLPFLLYRNIIYETIKHNTIYDIKYIYNMSDFIDSDNNILIMLIYCFIKDIDKNFYFLNKCVSKKILINTEFYKHCGVEKILNNINLNNKNNFYILDYNKLNIVNIKELYKNINIYYLPLLYNEYLEIFYSNYVKRKIPWEEKDIDILFYGSLNERRSNIIENLKKKYNVVYFIDIYNNEKLCEFIERSKIVLNILFYSYNIVFDYYRNIFLLANNSLLITEACKDIDIDIEFNLKDVNENIIMCNYNEIEEKIDNIFTKNSNQIEEIKNKQYNWVKKYNLKNNILNLLLKI